MRSTWLLPTALVAAVGIAGCGDDAEHGGGVQDMSVPDMTARDLLPPVACNPTDPMSDGTSCAAPGGCPAGTIGVNLDGACSCFTTCTTDTECSCNRLCDPVTLVDAGAGAACLPGNLEGTRCGRDSNNMPFGHVFCGQLAVCVNADPAAMFRYCSYKCESQTDCPAQTTCQEYLVNGQVAGNVCAYNSGVNGNKDLGQTCTNIDVCKTGLLCDGVCRTQCDGPGASCGGLGTCTRLDDPMNGKVIGYVCK